MSNETILELPDDIYEIRQVQRATWLDTYSNSKYGITKKVCDPATKLPSGKILPENDKILTMKEKWRTERLTKFNRVLPINGAEIPGFSSWINWNGFRSPETCGKNYQIIHQGYDFGAYLHQDGRKIVGLPEGVLVRAMANGRVDISGIRDHPLQYYQAIRINHQSWRGTFYSWYHHVEPLVKEGEFVKRGQPIAEIFRGEFNTPHLHFELMLPEGRFIDPGLLFPELYRYNLDSI